MPRLISNPANKAMLLDKFGVEYSSWLGRDFPFGMTVTWNDALPARKITQRWHPPPADRFVEYGPEDEHWMRPAGMGCIEEIDEGPLFYLCEDRLFFNRFDFMPAIQPRNSVIANCI